MRQRDIAERAALARLHAGDPASYLRWADGQIAVHSDSDGLGSALADWHAAVAEHGPAQAVLIARRQETRAALNDAARAQRRASGALGADVAYGTVAIAVGDRVICRRNDVDVDVDNGTRGTVRATHADRVVLETDAGTIRDLPAGYVAEHVEHAYCLTGHGMQGGTVEHATVLASIRDLTKGWSYTALSRTRGATRLHIDASETAAALERADVGGADVVVEPPDRAQILARAQAQMLVRDDEDLAVEQLPVRPAPGRVDDRELQRAPAAASPELGAQLAEPERDRPVSVDRLVALQHQHARLIAQRASLPLAELRQLDAIAAERTRVAGQCRDVDERLQALPDPSRSMLGRTRDPHAAKRARLTAAVAAADQQLAALDTQAERAKRTLGQPEAIREEKAGLDRRISELEHDTRQVRDQLADREVAARPAWARELLGERPEQYKRAEQWDRGARDVARYRIEHHVPQDTRGLGPEPARGPARGHWRQADRVLEQTQRRLGVEVDRDLHRER